MSDNRAVSYSISLRSYPSQGAKALQRVFDFSNGALAFQGDFAEETESGLIDFIQSVKIDNSRNLFPVQLTVAGVGIGDIVICPPQTILYSPIMSVGNGDPFRYIVATAGGVIVPITFVNIELAYFNYSTAASAKVTPSLITGIDTNHSFTTDGANHVVVPANANRMRVTIQNPPNNASSIWVRAGVAATMDNFSQEIPPGAQFDTGTGPLSLGDINVIGLAGNACFASEIHG